MPDPAEPVPPPPMASPEPDPSTKSATTDLPSNVAAALASVPLVGGIIFYVLEKQDSFVRFYAMQSIIFGGAWILFWIIYSIAFAILTPIPVIGLVFKVVLWATWLVAGLAFLTLWIVTMVKALKRVRWDIPYIGPMARKQVGEPA